MAQELILHLEKYRTIIVKNNEPYTTTKDLKLAAKRMQGEVDEKEIKETIIQKMAEINEHNEQLTKELVDEKELKVKIIQKLAKTIEHNKQLTKGLDDEKELKESISQKLEEITEYNEELTKDSRGVMKKKMNELQVELYNQKDLVDELDKIGQEKDKVNSKLETRASEMEARVSEHLETISKLKEELQRCMVDIEAFKSKNKTMLDSMHIVGSTDVYKQLMEKETERKTADDNTKAKEKKEKTQNDLTDAAEFRKDHSGESNINMSGNPDDKDQDGDDHWDMEGEWEGGRRRIKRRKTKRRRTKRRRTKGRKTKRRKTKRRKTKRRRT